MNLVPVISNIQGVKVETLISPSIYLYAVEHYENKEYSPCIKLYPKRTTEIDPPMKLNMTLEELSTRQGFRMLKGIKKDGSRYSIVVSLYAIRAIRRWENPHNKNKYVCYLCGYNEPQMTIFFEE